MLGGLILIDKAPHYFFSIVEFIKTVTEESCLLEVLNMRLTGLKFVELNAQGVENASYACVVRKHHSTNFVLCSYVGALLSQCYLYRGGSPRDEIS